MDMQNSVNSSRMKNLFVNYHSLLRQDGLNWILKVNNKIAVTHHLNAFKSQKLKVRLKSGILTPFADKRLQRIFQARTSNIGRFPTRG